MSSVVNVVKMIGDSVLWLIFIYPIWHKPNPWCSTVFSIIHMQLKVSLV